MLNENENTYLAKWLNNDLTSEELKELKELPEYEDYDKIVMGLEYFKAPSFDLEQSLETTINKLDQSKKGKVIRFRPFIYAISAAASVLLIIGLFFNKVSYTSAPGQQLAVTLPDGSTVDLNAGSSLTHQRFFWSNDRGVRLDGEAFFKVAKGSNFTVTTQLGKIEVLGTEFNVKGREKLFEVSCYEGKVRVSTTDNQQTVLEKGDAVTLKDKKLIQSKIADTQPLWMNGETLFNSVTLSLVLDEIERQYNISFIRNNIDQNKLFTGGFIHSDLDIALQSVLTPMAIRYTVVNKTVTLSPQ